MIVPLRWLTAVGGLFAVALGAFGQDPATTPASLPAKTLAQPPAKAPFFAIGDAVPAASLTVPAGPAEPQIVWSSVRVNGPFIAMTFDDGPSAKLTPQLLDLLRERNIHVTFFLVGENVKAHPEIVRREIAEGHEVGNHSWDHPDFAKHPDDFVRSQLDRTNDAIVDAIGKKPILMRPPYGSVTKEQKRWIADDMGFKIILWSVDPLDWKRPGPEIVHRRIVEGARAGSIILSHDIHPGTVEAMPATLDELLGKGFKFVTVSELLAMQLPPTPKPGGGGETASAHAVAHSGSKAAATPRIPDKITGAPE